MEHNLTDSLADSSVAELEQLTEEIKVAIEVRKKKDINDARIYVRELAASLGITLEQLIAAPSKPNKEKKKAAIKYRNTANDNEIWSGRGKQPKWLVEALANGAELEDFRVNAQDDD